MASYAIKTDKLTKRYGSARGVQDLELKVSAGEVFGFLGPNGAGKTTTIRLLLDFLKPTGGKASVFGYDTQNDSLKVRMVTGYLAGEAALYPKMRGSELLEYLAELRGKHSLEYGKEVAGRLGAELDRPIKHLSKGNKQKIALTQALMHKPKLLLLDEPTSGLDPLVQQTFYELIKEAKRNEQTAFISSHNLPEVEHVCDHVGIIKEGRLLATESIASLKERALRRLEIHFGSKIEKSAFAAVPNVQELRVEGRVLHATIKGSVDALIKAAAKNEVLNIVSQSSSLEEIFLGYYGGENG